QYQDKPVSGYTKWMYRSLFSKRYTHAVRDNYTRQKLIDIGITNVVNTGCPTVWDLNESHLSQINPHKRDVVVTTVTDYLRDAERDRQLFETLKRNYKEVYVWIQGSKDQPYIESLTTDVKYIAPKLSAFDQFLENQP